MSEEKMPFWAKCKCGHIWIAAYTPMEMRLFASVMKKVTCPMCGAGPKQICPAKQTAGVLEETVR